MYNKSQTKIQLKSYFLSYTSGDASNNEEETPYYDFLYIPHPRPVTGMSWRKTSPFMPR